MTPSEEAAVSVGAFRKAAAAAGHPVPEEAAAAGIDAALAAVNAARVNEAVRAALDSVFPAPALDAAQYDALLSQEATVTPAQYRAMEEYDRNVFWRMESGHIQNLLDAVLEHNEILVRVLEDHGISGPEQ